MLNSLPFEYENVRIVKTYACIKVIKKQENEAVTGIPGFV